MISMKKYVDLEKTNLKEKINILDTKPYLTVIQIGDNPASNSYINGKRKDCEEVGIGFELIKFKEDISECDILSIISLLNKNKIINGIIVQLPIPNHINIKKIQTAIAPEKDVDGFHKMSYFKPCTPLGIMNWLKYNDVKLRGKDVCVIGRSEIVGKPLVEMMIDEGATVICCNSKTELLTRYTTYADIVISAIGKPKFFNSIYFSSLSNEIIIDVGINRDKNGKLCGDVDKEDIEDKYGNDIYITPVPYGCGLSTRLALLQNTYTAYLIQNYIL